MSLYRISVVEGVAAVYKHGMNSTPAVLFDTDEGIVCGTDESVPKEEKGVVRKVVDALLPKAMEEDIDAPCAGVATDQPFGNRAGTIQVEVIKGTVVVRTYEGTDFTEHPITEGHKIRASVTETNRITLAVYEPE